MTVRTLALIAVTASLAGGDRLLIAERRALPTAATAQTLLSATPRHREWVQVPVGAGVVGAFVVYPERANGAPVVVVTGSKEGATDLAFPSANGISARLALDANQARIDVAIAAPASPQRSARFALNDRAWPGVLAYLTTETANRPVVSTGHAADHVGTSGHAGHTMPAMAQEPGRGGPGRGEPGRSEPGRGGQGRGGQGRGGGGGGITGKDPNVPASIWAASFTVARTKLRHEWVEIPVGDVKLRTWIEYPEGDGPAPVVIVMQHGPGLDDSMRAVADQLALDGFIAVAPDLFSGLGPNGGGWSSFRYPDEAMRAAAGKLTPEETLRRFKAARDYALKLPRASGKSASVGFCAGGTNSFRFAGEVPDLNAAVVFYGGPPDDATLARIKAPVIGFYGEDDARITSTVATTAATMKKLGKSFESHVYPGATHSFMLYIEGGNREAAGQAWPRAIAFLRQHTR